MNGRIISKHLNILYHDGLVPFGAHSAVVLVRTGTVAAE